MNNKNFLPIILIALLGAIVYANSLGNSFVYDDEITVTHNTMIKNWHNFPALFTSRYFSISGEISYRPLITLTYFIDYTFWKLKPFGYHLTNLLFHILSAILLYFLIQGLIPPAGTGQSPVEQTGKLANWFTLPFLTAFFFLIHPIQSEAVNAISFREDVLCTLFYFLSLLLYQRYRSSRNLRLYFLSLFSFLLALFSKEMAATLPVILILIDKVKSKTTHFRGYPEVKVYLPYWILLGFYLLVRFNWMKNPNPVEITYPGGSLYLSLLTTSRIFGSYIRLLLFPHPLCADYVIQASRAILKPGTLISLITLTILFILTIRSYRRFPILCLAGLWFFITLLPVANIIPLANPMAERYLYLPSVGFFLLLAVVLLKFYNIEVKHISPAVIKRATISILILLLTFYSFLSINRNRDWKDALTFYEKSLVQTPNSARFHNNLGRVYYEREQLDKAVIEYQKALQINPLLLEAYNNLGTVYGKQGLYNPAISEFKKILQLNPNFADAYNSLGFAYGEQGLYDKAISEIQKALQINPNFADAYLNLGVVYGKKDQLDQAIIEFQNALRLNPDLAEAYYSLGIAHRKKEWYDTAIREFDKALKIKPDYTEAHYSLAQVYLITGWYDRAIRELNQVLRIKPAYTDAHYSLAQVYLNTGRYDKAILEYRETLKFNPQFADAYNNLGYLYLKENVNLDEAIALIKKALSLKPENGNFIDSLGWAYYKKGMLAEALEQLEKAARLIPNDPNIYEHLAAVYEKKGMKKEAQKAREKTAAQKEE